jgi:TatD DNase family protein
MLVDSHAHLTSHRFADDLPEVLERAADAGISRIITIGIDLDHSRRALTLAASHPAISATVGIHPCDAHDPGAPDWQEQLAELARQPGVVAIGETGLDYYHPPPPPLDWPAYKALQADAFNFQLELATLLGLNVVIHQRGPCQQDLLQLLHPFHGHLRAVFHCWSGTWQDAAPLIDLGHLISFTGITTFKRSADLRDCAAAAPPGTFMLETDAPYLAPEPHRGKRCEPAHTRLTAAALAATRQEDLADFAAHTTQAAASFFKHASCPSAIMPRPTSC